MEDSVINRLPSNLLWVFGEHYTNALIAWSQNDTAVDKIAFQTKYYEQCESFIPDGFRFDYTPVKAEVDAINEVYYENIETETLSDDVRTLFELRVNPIFRCKSHI